MVTMQLLLAIISRDRRLCEVMPEGFPDQRRMCDAYVAYGETSEPKTLDDKYLDRGAIDQAMQGNVLLVGSSDGTFTNQAEERGVYDGGWAWNAKFADLDNDEWQDLYVVNGWWLENRVYSKKFFRNHQGERFVAEEEVFGLDSKLKESSYSYLDVDNDGDLDIASRAMHGTVDLYVNNEHSNHRVIFEFRDPYSTIDRVEVGLVYRRADGHRPATPGRRALRDHPRRRLARPLCRGASSRRPPPTNREAATRSPGAPRAARRRAAAPPRAA